MIKIKKKDIIESAFQYYRNHGFLYDCFADYEILQIFRNLQRSTSKIVNSREGIITNLVTTIRTNARINDQSLSNFFHPHIWDSHAQGMKSPTQSFAIDKSLRKCMTLSLKFGKEITVKSVRNYLRKVNGTQMCSNFRPSVAKAVYDYFDGNDVLDMSTGYGGRLLGFLASKRKGCYIGVDPSEKTCECNKKIAEYFGALDRVKIICKPFEEVGDLPKVDLAFTSPPYFAKEIYVENSPNQSREKFPDYEKWVEGFLIPVITKTKKALNPKGIMAININDIRINNKLFPLVTDTIKEAEKAGFVQKEMLKIQFSSFGKSLSKVKTEPILIFSKRKD